MKDISLSFLCPHCQATLAEIEKGGVLFQLNCGRCGFLSEGDALKSFVEKHVTSFIQKEVLKAFSPSDKQE